MVIGKLCIMLECTMALKWVYDECPNNPRTLQAIFTPQLPSSWTICSSYWQPEIVLLCPQIYVGLFGEFPTLYFWISPCHHTISRWMKFYSSHFCKWHSRLFKNNWRDRILVLPILLKHTLIDPKFPFMSVDIAPHWNGH